MARGYTQSRSEGNAGDGIGQKQAFDRIPKGTELPFGTVGEKINSNEELFDAFADYLYQGADAEDTANIIASDFGNDEIQSQVEAATEQSLEGGRTDGALFAVNIPGGGYEQDQDSGSGKGESDNFKTVLKSESGTSFEIEWSIETEEGSRYNRRTEEDDEYTHTSFNLKRVKIIT